MYDDRLALTLTDATGARWRLSDDEPDAENIPDDLVMTSSSPGGAKELSCSILRDPRVARRDVAPLNDVRAYGAGNRTLWNGFIARGPEAGDRLNPVAIGDAARMTDDKSLRMIGVDKDLSVWKPMSTNRRLSLLAPAGLYMPGDDPSVLTDGTSGLPRLRTGFTRDAAWDGTHRPIAEALYDAGWAGAASAITFGWTRSNDINAADTNWFWDVTAADNDALTLNPEYSANLRAAGPGVMTTFTPALPHRYWSLQLYYDGSGAPSASRLYEILWDSISIRGSQGIPYIARGSGPAGVFADDVLKAALNLADCGIGYSADSIAPARDFILPHIKWPDPVDLSTMVLDTNKAFQRPWLVRDKLLYWDEAANIGRLWRARRSEGVKPSNAGFDSEHIFSGVAVRYTDGAGTTGMVGPPSTGLVGPLGLDTSALQDTDETNPALQWGRTKIAVVDAGLTTEDGAIRIGAYFLQALKLRRSSGSVELASFQFFDETGARYPASEIGACDRLLIEDEANAEERFIVDASYKRASRSTSLSLDSPPDRLDAILERLQLVLVGVV